MLSKGYKIDTIKDITGLSKKNKNVVKKLGQSRYFDMLIRS